MARLGLLDDALPMFGSVSALPRAGVLLAIPALVQSGIFDCAQKVYGSIGPAFYGLRTSVLTLLLMALWRIKPEVLANDHAEIGAFATGVTSMECEGAVLEKSRVGFSSGHRFPLKAGS
jgi:hypothetical protein